MFCPKCGKSVVDSAKFCPSCGSALLTRGASVAQSVSSEKGSAPEVNVKAVGSQSRQRKAESSAKKSKGGSPFNWAYALAVGDVLLILLAFAPWVSLNVVMYSMQYSLLDLATMAFRFNSLASSYLDSGSGAIVAAGVLACLVLILMVALFAYDAYRRIKGKPFSAMAFAVSCLLSVLAIIAIFVIDGMIAGESSDYLGSSSLSGTLTPTLWVWVFLILSIVCSVVACTKRNKQDK